MNKKKIMSGLLFIIVFAIIVFVAIVFVINKKEIIRVKKNRLDYQVLINKKSMKKEYNKYIKNITTLDDIMLLYIRGSVCED